MKNLIQIVCLIIQFSCAFGQVPNYVPTYGLVAWYPFNGNANDESGNGNNGTVFSSSVINDRNANVNSAYSFYSVNDYIEVNTTGGAFDSQTYTISFWYRTNQPASVDPPPPMISRLNSSGSVYDNFCIFESGGFAHLNYPGAGPPYGVSVINNINDNNWHHIVFAVNTDSLRSYFDGQLSEKNPYIAGINFQNYPIRIGKSAHSYWTEFSGDLDDIGFWNRALSPTEINQLFTGIYLGDTCSVTLYDTVTTNISVYDTTIITAFDTITTNISIYDTTTVTVYDTSYVSVYDTTTITANDTNNIVVNDTIIFIDTIAATGNCETLVIKIVVGVGSPNNINTITIYPNPASQEIIIDNGNYVLINGFKVRVNDVNGMQKYLGDIDQQVLIINISDVSDWPTGTYFVQILDPSLNVVITRKILVTRQ